MKRHDRKFGAERQAVHKEHIAAVRGVDYEGRARRVRYGVYRLNLGAEPVIRRARYKDGRNVGILFERRIYVYGRNGGKHSLRRKRRI